jgi:hypothetical protein
MLLGHFFFCKDNYLKKYCRLIYYFRIFRLLVEITVIYYLMEVIIHSLKQLNLNLSLLSDH